MSLYIIKEITGQKSNAISHNDNFEDYTDFFWIRQCFNLRFGLILNWDVIIVLCVCVSDIIHCTSVVKKANSSLV